MLSRFGPSIAQMIDGRDDYTGFLLDKIRNCISLVLCYVSEACMWCLHCLRRLDSSDALETEFAYAREW